MSITTEYFQILILKSNKILKKSDFKQDNDDEDVLRKIKRGFFIESPKMNLNLIQYIMQKHLLFLQMLKNIQLDL